MHPTLAHLTSLPHWHGSDLLWLGLMVAAMLGAVRLLKAKSD